MVRRAADVDHVTCDYFLLVSCMTTTIKVFFLVFQSAFGFIVGIVRRNPPRARPFTKASF